MNEVNFAKTLSLHHCFDLSAQMCTVGINEDEVIFSWDILMEFFKLSQWLA